jgi:hypothetical protein
LDKITKASWLLNYRGVLFIAWCRNPNARYAVSVLKSSDAEELTILNEISSPSQNMESVCCWKAPKIAVYTRENSLGMML